jgi:hypothetical protein
MAGILGMRGGLVHGVSEGGKQAVNKSVFVNFRNGKKGPK